MIKIDVIAPKIDSVTIVSFEQMAKRVSAAAKKTVSQTCEHLEGKPLDLNYDEIFNERMFAGINPNTGKVKYISNSILDRYI